MSGIYLHIPFCRKACIYCDFHFSTSFKHKGEMVEAICAEINFRKDFLSAKKIDTIYFGGGTPSLLSREELKEIFDTLNENFEIEPGAEITLEANPDDLSPQKLGELKESPVNRLSIGVQSFRDEDLQMMNRSHNARQAVNSIKMAKDAGFENISLDLIYAIPGMSDEEWREQIDRAIELQVPHISSYALTVEPKTVLAHMIKSGKIKEVEDEVAARQFEILWKYLTGSGYDHYEVSNFALPTFRARHNSSYWKGAPYLGVGPAAHSFEGSMRRWNVSNNVLYIRGVKKRQLHYESESLSDIDRFNEFLMTSLRTREGIDLNVAKENFNEKYSSLMKEAVPLINEGKLVKGKGYLYIPQEWRFHSDGIAADLFLI